MLDALPVAAHPRLAALPTDERVAEFLTDDQVLPRFHVWTLGCQMNQSDSEEMAGALLAAGCTEAPVIDQADLIVINSCAIREAAEHKIIGRMGALGRMKAANPALRVVLTGCSVRADGLVDLHRRYPEVDLFLRPDQEPELTQRLGLASATAAASSADGLPAQDTLQRVGIGVAATADRLPGTRAAAVESGRVARASRSHAWLPIIYGCDKTCTYCIVPFSRGPERSRPFDDVIAEAHALAASGALDVTLLGQNVNSYGHDLPAEPRFGDVHAKRHLGRDLSLDGRPDMAALLHAIDAIRDGNDRPAIPRLRFVTSHPWDLSDRLIDAMASCDSVCEHLHLPVQAGDDTVLRRMGRQYTIEAYLDLVARLRAAVPDIALTTDVIVGFCGETEAQFQATLELLRTVRYDGVFAAAFSPRPGTPASRLPDDVPADVKRRRLNELLALQEGIGLERNQAWVGRRVEVLVDQVRRPRSHDHEAGEGSSTRVAGRSRVNKLVHLDGGPELVGRFVEVDIDHAGPYALSGRLAGVH
ncbi:MAG: tRNA (N6-isopentenyl adenosine(37)-C2)-methylthiotransferase MiaB [Chloroflexi bacterium]|nr:tRNA (N6-isopentenyl adenosine(37)-C2)-methylthiotransferase MiaB [Chloroflexota bacterium]